MKCSPGSAVGHHDRACHDQHASPPLNRRSSPSGGSRKYCRISIVFDLLYFRTADRFLPQLVLAPENNFPKPVAYRSALAISEKTCPVRIPMNWIVPTTSASTTASITAYSAMPSPSSANPKRKSF